MEGCARTTFTVDEVAKHNRPDDCWVIVHGEVIDVTSFLHQHPGGPAALSKPGRVGLDVTEHFVRIGHSQDAHKLVRSMRVGALAAASGTRVGAPDDDDREDSYAIEWHGRRRAAILAAHPEVSRLQGSNPWTPLIGIACGAVHAYASLYCGSAGSALAPFCLAYTVGAMVKMWQFAVAHDLCHGTAGPLSAHPVGRHVALALCTLPSFGGETHHYYGYQHIGHHASLGAVARLTRKKTSLDATLDAAAPYGGEREAARGAARAGAAGDGEASEAANEATPLAASAEPLGTGSNAGDARITSLDQLDGDLPSPSTLLLLAFSSRSVRRMSDQVRRFLASSAKAAASGGARGGGLAAAEEGVSFSPGAGGEHEGDAREDGVEELARVLGWGERGRVVGRWLDPLGWRMRVLAQPVMVAGHTLMLIALQLTFGVVANPLTLLGIASAYAAPRRLWLAAARRWAEPGLADEVVAKVDEMWRALETDPLMRESLHAFVCVGAHTWLWAGIFVYLSILGGAHEA